MTCKTTDESLIVSKAILRKRETVDSLSLNDPFLWVKKGWRDFVQAPLIGVFFGLSFTFAGWVLVWVFQRSIGWTWALSAGFLLLGPFLCLGLYSVSRSIERGERPTLQNALMAWNNNIGSLLPYLIALLILEMLWGRAAMVVFAVSFSSLPPEGDVLSIVLNIENLGFVMTYLGVGALFAGLIFATSVVSIPMILDRNVDGVSASISSIQVCLNNPLVMLVWGAMIAILTGLAILPYFLGLVVVAPVIGHASWHAYRRCISQSSAESLSP